MYLDLKLFPLLVKICLWPHLQALAWHFDQDRSNKMLQKITPPPCSNELHNIPLFTYITFSPSFGQHFILLSNGFLQFHCSSVQLILAMAIYLTKNYLCYKCVKNNPMHLQSSITIVLGSFTPSLNFSVKLLYISFFTHQKCI